MEFFILGLLFFIGFSLIPIFLFLGFILIKIIFWSVIIIALASLFGSGLAFVLFMGFVAYLFFYWIFGSRKSV